MDTTGNPRCNLRPLAVVKTVCRPDGTRDAAAGTDQVPAWRYRRQMPASTGEGPFDSWTGRAISARPGHAPADAPSGATILVASPGCWPQGSGATMALAWPGLRVVLSAEPFGLHSHKLINTGILPARIPPQTVAELQAAVDSDAGILLTVDIYRCDVRARGRVVGRFEPPPFWFGQGGDGMARRLLMVQRLLGSADLVGDNRSRFQRRFAAICDGMKAPGADAERSAWRLDRLLADLAGNPLADRPASRARPEQSGPPRAGGSVGAGPD
jgi:3-isopropylmalate dehydratase small subunit